jgi:hypothetical protein
MIFVLTTNNHNIWSIIISRAFDYFFSTGITMTSKTYLGCPCPPTISFVQRLGSAIFYGACSCLITIVNKLVLTSYGYVIFFYMRFFFRSSFVPLLHNRFPSFQLLAIGQVSENRE